MNVERKSQSEGVMFGRRDRRRERVPRRSEELALHIPKGHRGSLGSTRKKSRSHGLCFPEGAVRPPGKVSPRSSNPDACDSTTQRQFGSFPDLLSPRT
jgi:hypothetical protein